MVTKGMGEIRYQWYIWVVVGGGRYIPLTLEGLYGYGWHKDQIRFKFIQK